MTAEIIHFDGYLRRKRATGKALADEALAEAALPGAVKEVTLTEATWEDLKQIQHRRDELNQQPALVSYKTWAHVYKAMDDLALKLACLRVQRGPSRLDE